MYIVFKKSGCTLEIMEIGKITTKIPRNREERTRKVKTNTKTKVSRKSLKVVHTKTRSRRPTNPRFYIYTINHYSQNGSQRAHRNVW